MHDSVRKAFTDFSVKFEGCVSSMYCDVLGLITTAVGCLIDPLPSALALPWKHEKTGALAPQAEIAAAWNALKAQKDKYAKLHWKYAAALNDLRLDSDSIEAVVAQRLLANEKVLRGYFPNFDLMPADAQLGIFSMSWALGAGFPHTFGNFKTAAVGQNWTSAIATCGIRTDGNPGIIPRNAANKLCFANAASVLAQGLPLDSLFWPGTAPSASQRDQALQTEADEAAKAHADALNQLTTDALAAIDLRADRDAPDYGAAT